MTDKDLETRVARAICEAENAGVGEYYNDPKCWGIHAKAAIAEMQKGLPSVDEMVKICVNESKKTYNEELAVYYCPDCKRDLVDDEVKSYENTDCEDYIEGKAQHFIGYICDYCASQNIFMTGEYRIKEHGLELSKAMEQAAQQIHNLITERVK